MNIIEKLNREFAEFILSNNDDIFNFFINQSHTSLTKYKIDFENFLEYHFNDIEELDLSINENQIFIDVIIDACERLNLSFYFPLLCRIKKQKGLQLSKRNEATSLYINGLRELADFSNILKSLLDKLQFAFEKEEDTNKRALAVFFNFYANIIRDFGPLDGVISIINSIKEKKDNYSFLSSEITDEILGININDSEKAYNEIFSILDDYLENESIVYSYSDKDYLIELEGEYVNRLNEIESDIKEIRRIASSFYIASDEVFYSMGRGVTILNQQQQLYAYLNSYGNMHFAKCNYAYAKLPHDFFDNNIEIIDWGCGQALASMTYLDFLKKQNITQDIEKIILNEPSEIALKRGALHIKIFNANIEILTINKDLDGITPSDFISNNCVKLHLFSNILDIDNYSTKHLADLIKQNFKGLNYFIIVSPKITDLKTNRIDNFVKEFDLMNPEVIANENKNVGEWECNWTMVFRLLKVNIK